jgi:hypothetical protein
MPSSGITRRNIPEDGILNRLIFLGLKEIQKKHGKLLMLVASLMPHSNSVNNFE